MQFNYLTQQFYTKYNQCPEILEKNTRPYLVKLIKIEALTYAIPMRTHINIKNKDCFITDHEKNSGLDFIKTVVLAKNEYINTNKFAKIHQSEYNYIKFSEFMIEKAFKKFVRNYRKDVERHKKNPTIPPNPRFQYCALQYFHKELKL